MEDDHGLREVLGKRSTCKLVFIADLESVLEMELLSQPQWKLP